MVLIQYESTNMVCMIGSNSYNLLGEGEYPLLNLILIESTFFVDGENMPEFGAKIKKISLNFLAHMNTFFAATIPSSLYLRDPLLSK